MGKPQQSGAAQNQAPQAPQGGAGKAQASESHAKRPEVGPRGKGHTPLPDGCHAVGCKHKSARFNFCDEHYEHFKFGLIKKTGEPVLDYEKKFEHFRAYQERRAASARKVA